MLTTRLRFRILTPNFVPALPIVSPPRSLESTDAAIKCDDVQCSQYATAWAETSAAVLTALRARSADAFGAPLVLTDVSWHMQLGLGSGAESGIKGSSATLDFSLVGRASAASDAAAPAAAAAAGGAAADGKAPSAAAAAPGAPASVVSVECSRTDLLDLLEKLDLIQDQVDALSA